jgi:transcriptional regulator with XRE-family HTH domain
MEQSTKELLGVRIKELRKLRSLTQDQLSQKVNIDPKHLSRIEVGRSFPSFDTLERLADALQVELNTFFEFAHKARSTRELKKIISELLKDADEERLRLVVKILKGVLR